jgi:hypothetical protein
MIRPPELSIGGPDPTAQEAAAIVAALERFRRDTAPVAGPAPERRSPWVEASLHEGVARQPGLLPVWI